MSGLALHHRLKRFGNKLRVLGLRNAFKSVSGLFEARNSFPLERADPDLTLASSVGAIRDFARRQRAAGPTRQTAQADPSLRFPLVFTSSTGRKMRYAFFPALEQSKGLAVVFHGYLGFEIDHLRYGWKHFNLLLPLDNFGWNELGSWFWGEAGSGFVAHMTRELIAQVQAENNEQSWFAVGASMGGFAALFHGIIGEAQGIYVMTPILDLKRKIRSYRERGLRTSYTEIADPADISLAKVPDIYTAAKEAKSLPPLFLTQNQYDRSNPFGSDTLPLLKIYDEKKAWLGLRVHPAIGHQGHDGSYDEAQYFFEMIAKKSPPHRVDFFQEDEGQSNPAASGSQPA